MTTMNEADKTEFCSECGGRGEIPNGIFEPATIDCRCQLKYTRIQLRRTKGWTMPANTVKVDRTTMFGNPFAVGKAGPGGFVAKDKRHAWQLFLGFAPKNNKLVEAAKQQLRGKNLACWCKLPASYADDECHAAVLLEIANA